MFCRKFCVLKIFQCILRTYIHIIKMINANCYVRMKFGTKYTYIHIHIYTYMYQLVFRMNYHIYAFTYYNDVMMSAMESQITSLTIICSTVYSGVGQRRKHQSSALLAFVRGIHRWPVNSPHKGPVTRKTYPFHDFIMLATTSISKKKIDVILTALQLPLINDFHVSITI